MKTSRTTSKANAHSKQKSAAAAVAAAAAAAATASRKRQRPDQSHPINYQQEKTLTATAAAATTTVTTEAIVVKPDHTRRRRQPQHSQHGHLKAQPKNRRRYSRKDVVSSSTAMGMQQLPDIPSVPLSINPLLVQAFRSTSHFLSQYYTTKLLSPSFIHDDDSSQQQSQQPSSTSSSHPNNNHVLDTILHRLQESNPTRIEQQRQQQQLEFDMNHSIQTFLRAVANEVRSLNTYNSTSTTTSASSQQQPHTPSVPLACFKFLWKLQWPKQQHQAQQLLRQPNNNGSHVAQRRAVLHIAGLLLQKSCECRHYWCSGTESNDDQVQDDDNVDDGESNVASIRAWIQQCLVMNDVQQQQRQARRANDSSSSSSASSCSSSSLLYQREAFLLLQWLLQEGYGDVYPQLHVAQRMVLQVCPHVTITSNGTGEDDDHVIIDEDDNYFQHHHPTRQIEWRRRQCELAMQHVSQEKTAVHKLLSRVYKCIHILAPPHAFYGGGDDYYNDNEQQNHHQNSHNSMTSSCNNEHSNNNHFPVDDDDDIDWEDGLENVVDDELVDNHQHDVAHSISEMVDFGPAARGGSCHSSVDIHQHESSVERTLALMKATRSIDGGQIEINFSNDNCDETANLQQNPMAGTTTSTSCEGVFGGQQHQQARARLVRCLIRLQQTHLPRLSAWVEGLIHSDGLVQVVVAENASGATSQTSASSWVRMPSNQLQLRRQVQVQVMELKQAVVAVLACAARLGITSKTNTAETLSSPQSPMAPPHPQVVGENRSPNVGEAMIPSSTAKRLTNLSSSTTSIEPPRGTATNGTATTSSYAKKRFAASRKQTKRFQNHRIQIQYRSNDEVEEKEGTPSKRNG